MDNLTALADYFNVTLDYLAAGREQRMEPDRNQVVVERPCCPYWHYEFKSRRTLLGLPLVHINLGPGLRCARGVLAVGNLALGGVALGGVAAGAFSIGGLSLGLLLALGGAALGGVAVGGLACGILALGGISWGWLSLGGIAKGVYAVGGIACGSRIAIGQIASAPLAIGDEAEGAVTVLIGSETSREAVRQAIAQALPDGPRFLERWLTALAAHIHSTPIR